MSLKRRGTRTEVHVPGLACPADPGILLSDIADLDTTMPRFIEAIGKHRHAGRETVPKPG